MWVAPWSIQSCPALRLPVEISGLQIISEAKLNKFLSRSSNWLIPVFSFQAQFQFRVHRDNTKHYSAEILPLFYLFFLCWSWSKENTVLEVSDKNGSRLGISHGFGGRRPVFGGQCDVRAGFAHHPDRQPRCLEEVPGEDGQHRTVSEKFSTSFC